MSETKDWRKICAACQEGEPPKDCEYFGEPGGCNAKTMGKHPTCKESLQVGNISAMRKALEVMLDWYDEHHDDVAAMDEAMEKARDALSKPPRNCDMLDNETDARVAWDEYCTSENLPRSCTTEGAFVPWLFAKAKGEVK